MCKSILHDLMTVPTRINLPIVVRGVILWLRLLRGDTKGCFVVKPCFSYV